MPHKGIQILRSGGKAEIEGIVEGLCGGPSVPGRRHDGAGKAPGLRDYPHGLIKICRRGLLEFLFLMAKIDGTGHGVDREMCFFSVFQDAAAGIVCHVVFPAGHIVDVHITAFQFRARHVFAEPRLHQFFSLRGGSFLFLRGGLFFVAACEAEDRRAEKQQEQACFFHKGSPFFRKYFSFCIPCYLNGPGLESGNMIL